VLSVSLANFATMLVLLRRGVRVAPWSAAIGAFLFAFAGPRLAQAGHLQLYPHFYTPLCAWATIEFFRAPTARARRGWLSLAVAAVVLQVYAGFYLGWFLVLAISVLGAWAIVLPAYRRKLILHAREHWAAAVGAAVVAALAMAPMLLHYTAVARQYGTRNFDEVLLMLPRPASWLYAGDLSWMYGWTIEFGIFQSLTMRHEHRIFVGVFTAIAATVGLIVARRDRTVRLIGLGLIAILVLTLLLPGNVTLWRAVYSVVPGAGAIRGVTRIVMLVLVPLGVGLACFFDRLERSRRFGLIIPLALLCMLEQPQKAFSFDKRANRAEIEWLASQIPSHCKHFLFTPGHGARPWYKYELDAMWAAVERQVPTVNGYSGLWPKEYLPFMANTIEQPMDRKPIQEFLDRWPTAHGFVFDPDCWIEAVPSDSSVDAVPLEQTVERAMIAGGEYAARVKMRNTGTGPWKTGLAFALGARNGGAPSPWGMERVALPIEVPPGESVTFEFKVRAPATRGQHLFQWQMVQDGVQWFGSTSDPVFIQVVDTPNPAPAAGPNARGSSRPEMAPRSGRARAVSSQPTH
jgi:hypothetical protein